MVKHKYQVLARRSINGVSQLIGSYDPTTNVRHAVQQQDNMVSRYLSEYGYKPHLAWPGFDHIAVQLLEDGVVTNTTYITCGGMRFDNKVDRALVFY